MSGKKPTRLPARRAKCGCVVQVIKPCSLHANLPGTEDAPWELLPPKAAKPKEEETEVPQPFDWSPYYFTTDCYVKKRDRSEGYTELCACRKYSMVWRNGFGEKIGLLGGSQIGGMVHRPLVCSPFPLHRKLHPPEPGQAIRDVDPHMLATGPA